MTNLNIKTRIKTKKVLIDKKKVTNPLPLYKFETRNKAAIRRIMLKKLNRLCTICSKKLPSSQLGYLCDMCKIQAKYTKLNRELQYVKFQLRLILESSNKKISTSSNRKEGSEDEPR